MCVCANEKAMDATEGPVGYLVKEMFVPYKA